MRAPFLFLLLLASLWVWSTDLIDILFYFLNITHTETLQNIVALLPFLLICFLFYLLLKKYYRDVDFITLSSSSGKELIQLVLFFTPILFLNYERIMFPDVDYDTGAYHLFLHNLDRIENKNNFNLIGSSGGGTYFFTLSYKIFGLVKSLVGFRIATLLNTFILFLIYLSVYDFIKKGIREFQKWENPPTLSLALSSLFVIFSFNALFNLNSYKVDAIGVPLLLEMLHIAFFYRLTVTNKKYIVPLFFLFASIAIAYKLIFLPYTLLLTGIFLYKNWELFKKNFYLIAWGFAAVVFSLPYMLYNYAETQNPIFPFYNKIFQSSLYSLKNFKDERWGPRSLIEFFGYAIVCFKDKIRNNEWHIFSYRLLAEYFIIAGLLFAVVFKKIRTKIGVPSSLISLSLLAIICNYFLIATTGYYRYGVFIEVLFGLILIFCLFFFYHKKHTLAFALLFCFCVKQVSTVLTDIYINKNNISWYYYDQMKENKDSYKRETGLLFKDFAKNEIKLDSSLQIQAFLSSELNGYAKVLAPEIPIYNLYTMPTRKTEVEAFANRVVYPLSRQKGLYTIATKESIMDKIQQLNENRFIVDSIVDIYPNFRPYNDPVFLLRAVFVNDSATINNSLNMLRNDSSGISDNFKYVAHNSFVAFIIQDPYTYTWQSSVDSFSYYVNDMHISGKKSKKINRFLIDNELHFKNEKELHYYIIIQNIHLPMRKESE